MCLSVPLLLQEALEVDDEAFMATLANLTLLIVSFDLEDQAAAIDLDQFSAGPYLLAKRRSCQVAYIHHCANRHISWLQVIGHRSPGGILHARDHHAVVIHDNTVDKRTNGKGNILDLDFVYLRSLNAAAYFPGGWPEPQQIPTLREVLDLARGHAQVYIEIKASKRDGVQGRYPHIAETVVDEVRSAGMLDQVLIIS